MNTRYLIACVGLIFGIGHAHAEIATEAKNVKEGIGSFKEFSTKETPCFIREPGWAGKASPLGDFFAEAGMNIVKEDSAPCQILYNSYVTLSKGEGKPVIPVDAEYILKNQETMSEVEPALSSGNVTADKDKAVNEAGAMAGVISPGNMTNISQAGHVVNGMNGSIAAVLIGSLIDSTVAIGARNKTPSGVGYVMISLTYGQGFFKSGLLSAEVYSASTSKEKPVDLLRAAAKRLVQEIQAKEDEFKKREADKSGTATKTTLTSAQEAKK